MSKHSIHELKVVNRFADLPGSFYTELPTQPLKDPRLLHANARAAALLGLSVDALDEADFLQVMAGAQALPNGRTLAAVYSGHQFGVWAGQLGDGRAHLLGEVVGPTGSWEIQLKGSGLTPYSRMGDGRAVLRSSVREYLASEAMAGLGIPTTRALALVVSDDPVYRETVETAAIVARVSPTFVRFGSFEHWAGSPDNLRRLFDYVVDTFYPECRHPPAGKTETPSGVICRFLQEVTRRTARLIADWQTVGFCHGVMNTDNMSILGLTLDYGPYGFMDGFQANHICNHSDSGGRYAWNVQPSIGNWNLYRLGSSLLGLDADPEELKAVLQEYEQFFLGRYRANLRRKFGLLSWQEDDNQLADDWWRLLHNDKADFTLSFRRLALAPNDKQAFTAHFQDSSAAAGWLDRYLDRLDQDGVAGPERIASMQSVNPLYVLRNHLAEGAIRQAKQNDASEIDRLLMVLREPFTERPGFESYAAEPPAWASQLEVSCSS
jgi:uncharacterized protein YdiU (UPF0061 family)